MGTFSIAEDLTYATSIVVSFSYAVTERAGEFIIQFTFFIE
jgi:hypothetical protein